MKTHWTNRSLEDYVFAIARDFIVQLENKMEDIGLSQDELNILNPLPSRFLSSNAQIFFEQIDPDDPRAGKLSSDLKSEDPRPAGLV